MKNTERLKGRIAQAFASSMDDPEAARDIAFHMTDWDHNVNDLIKLYEQPESFSDDEILSIIIRFLAHVPNHVAAAKKLAGIGPIEDVFEVGVFEENE
ncbi:MAG TPA: hypothetical protein VE732_04185 [Nitrososphaera sp.]|jgi:hypothetical protein|nr:hypothetical protein [Nitrososphaera sp.]